MKHTKNILPDLFLILLTLLCVWLFVLRHGAFASSVDYLSQHSVFPDYFRQQFYATGQLFPQFAPNLGGGQNIFYFAYYGLLSPVILPSYLLPTVSMELYLQVALILCLMALVLLMYHWLLRKGYTQAVSLLAACFLLLAGPMIFHSYRHIMFVDYMPFLLLALMGVDRFWSRGRSGLLIAGVFLMVMTSFYFSVGGLLALWLYGTCQAHRQRRFGYLRFLAALGVGVLTAACLLLPSFLALMSRSGSGTSVDWKALLLPDPDPMRFCYNTYSIGLPTLFLSALLFLLLYGTKRRRLLVLGLLGLLLVPFCCWLLGGMLYVREKSLIPLLPLLCECIACYLSQLREAEPPRSRLAIPFGISFSLCLCYAMFQRNGTNAQLYLLLLGDSAVMLLTALVFRRRPAVPALCALCMLFCFGWYGNATAGEIIPADEYQSYTSAALSSRISDLLSQEPGWYRLEESGGYRWRKANINRIQTSRQYITSVYSSASNPQYQQFCRDVFQIEQPFRNCLMQGASQNPLFRKLMGVKYAVDPATGAVDTQEGTAPIAYSTTKLLSREDFQQLSFPYTQLALTQYAVTDTGSTSDPNWRANLKAMCAPAEVTLSSSPAIHQSGGSWRVQTTQRISSTLTLHGSASDTTQLLFLQFDVENNRKHRDMEITVSGMKNKLTASSHIYYNGNTTFTYVVPLSAGQVSVPITFGAGSYRISGLHCWTASADLLSDTSLYQSVFQPDQTAHMGSRITGTISVSDTEAFVTSIPYDSGFQVLVDGQAVPTAAVNVSFLGFYVSPGTHRVEILYHAPGYRAGILLSGFGVLLWIVLLLGEGLVSRGKGRNQEPDP